MITMHPQYITDHEGNKISVVLSIKEFESLLEEIEELEDIRAYDDAKAEDDGKRITIDDYIASRNLQNE